MKKTGPRRQIYDALAERFDSEYADELVGDLAAEGKLNDATVGRLKQLLLIDKPVRYDEQKISELMLDFTPTSVPPPMPGFVLDKSIIELANKMDLKWDKGTLVNESESIAKGFAEYGYTLEDAKKFQEAESSVTAAVFYSLTNDTVNQFKQNDKLKQATARFSVGESHYDQTLDRVNAHMNIHPVNSHSRYSNHLMAVRENFRNQMRELNKKQ